MFNWKKREKKEKEREFQTSAALHTARSIWYRLMAAGLLISLCAAPLRPLFFEFFNHGILCLFKGSFLSTGRCWAYSRRLFYKTYRQDTSRNGTRMQQSSLRLLDCFLLCALKAIINTFFDFNYRFFSHSLPFSSACYCTYTDRSISWRINPRRASHLHSEFFFHFSLFPLWFRLYIYILIFRLYLLSVCEEIFGNKPLVNFFFL